MYTSLEQLYASLKGDGSAGEALALGAAGTPGPPTAPPLEASPSAPSSATLGTAATAAASPLLREAPDDVTGAPEAAYAHAGGKPKPPPTPEEEAQKVQQQLSRLKAELTHLLHVID